MKRGGLLRREPLGILLVAANLALAAALVWRHRSARAGGLPPGHPDVSVPGPLASAAPADAALALNGVVRLAPELKARWPRGACVFVIARGEGGGPPYAVRRYEKAAPPLAWSLSDADAMLAGVPAPARLVASALVSQSCDPLARRLGDLETAPSAPLAPRADVELVVDREAPLGR